jgi:hypothetical protein
MNRLSHRRRRGLSGIGQALTERQMADALGLRHGTVCAYEAHLHAAGLLRRQGEVRRLYGERRGVSRRP